MPLSERFYSAFPAAGVHLLCSIVIALMASALVFGVWYPFPYRELSGGRELFGIVVLVDLVCGPLLTLVLVTPNKRRKELFWDIGCIVLIQLAALGYGLSTIARARPLFLVQEIDRFRVISRAEVLDTDLVKLPLALQPHLFFGPTVVSIRLPIDEQERQKVMFESMQGGRDYAERPEFYLLYGGASALKSLLRAKPLAVFLQRYPTQHADAQALGREKSADIAQWMYLPVVGRQDWIAILDKKGQIQGFLKGDGF